MNAFALLLLVRKHTVRNASLNQQCMHGSSFVDHQIKDCESLGTLKKVVETIPYCLFSHSFPLTTNWKLTGWKHI